jgi:hypothetical protein
MDWLGFIVAVGLFVVAIRCWELGIDALSSKR